MIRRILAGATAGVIATGPQSAVVWGSRAAGVYHRRPPPEVLAEGPTNAAVDAGVLPSHLWRPAMLVEHVGFGAAGGILFAFVSSVVRPTMLAGVVTGLAIWKASYDGWIPALRIMPPPERDETGRQLTMVIAHVAYGLSLATAFKRLNGRA
jgi:uncharacterized membrane protein YagU involved in acid resistance